MNDMVLYELKERVGYITLNRPEKRNALSFDFVTQIKNAIKQAEDDAACKIIVIKANGEAFCSGADLSSLQKLQTNTYQQNLDDSLHLMELFKQIYWCSKVVITQVKGSAFAGGCGLATIADFCFATEHAKFAYTEVKIGFIPAIVMVFLIRKIGESAAKKLLLTGDVITAEQALNCGLITHTADEKIIDETVHNFALKLCNQNSANSMQVTKQMIAKVQDMSLDEALNFATKSNATVRASDDCKKGINAFLNKEKLMW